MNEKVRVKVSRKHLMRYVQVRKWWGWKTIYSSRSKSDISMFMKTINDYHDKS